MYHFDIQDNQGVVTVKGDSGTKEHRHVVVVEPKVAS